MNKLPINKTQNQNRLEHVSEQDRNEQAHAAAAKKTGYWGHEGSGCVVFARRTGRILIGLRSLEVMEGNTWGTWGGAIDEGFTPKENAHKELKEETRITEEPEMIPVFVFESEAGDFRYHNFIAVVENEFQPELNWEHDGYNWVEAGHWPLRMHPGLKILVEQEEFKRLIADLKTASAPTPTPHS